MTTRFDYSDANQNDVLAVDRFEETQSMRPAQTDEASNLSTHVISESLSDILGSPDRHQGSDDDFENDSDQWVAIPAYAGIEDDDDDFDEDDDYLDDDDDDFGDDFDDDDDEESFDGGDWEEVDDDDDWEDDDDDDDDDWEDDDVDDWD